MPKQAQKYKTRPVKEKQYQKTLKLTKEYTFDERESILRRFIYTEQDKYKGKPFRFIVAEKTMEQIKVNFFVKKINESK